MLRYVFGWLKWHIVRGWGRPNEMGFMKGATASKKITSLTLHRRNDDLLNRRMRLHKSFVD